MMEPQLLLIQANALHIPLADKSVHMICTSPPYFKLRDYNVEGQLGQEQLHDCLGWATGGNCQACYLCHLRLVAQELWRVLRDDGTLWLVIGDSMAATGKSGGGKQGQRWAAQGAHTVGPRGGHWSPAPPGLKPKDRAGIPFRVALALQADGWTLRSDIIWSKPNPMPDSQRDRPTTSHEYVFLLSKKRQYFYDGEAIAEDAIATKNRGGAHKVQQLVSSPGAKNDGFGVRGQPRRKSEAFGQNGRNVQATNGESERRDQPGTFSNNPAMRPNTMRTARDVWHVATEPYDSAHFATMPQELAAKCISAGTPAHGVCHACGAPWKERITRQRLLDGHLPVTGAFRKPSEPFGAPRNGIGHERYSTKITRHGWAPTCRCFAGPGYPAPVPATVLDPFAGSGTTIEAARALGRHGVGLDLSLVYLRDLARERTGMTDPQQSIFPQAPMAKPQPVQMLLMEDV